MLGKALMYIQRTWYMYNNVIKKKLTAATADGTKDILWLLVLHLGRLDLCPQGSSWNSAHRG